MSSSDVKFGTKLALLEGECAAEAPLPVLGDTKVATSAAAFHNCRAYTTQASQARVLFEENMSRCPQC